MGKTTIALGYCLTVFSGCCPRRPIDPAAFLRRWVVGGTATVFMVAGLLLLPACDPGLRYQPVDWERSGDGAWEYANEDLHIAMEPEGGLAGSSWLTVGPEIENRTLETIAIGAVTLVSGPVRYEGRLFAGESKLLSLGEKRHVAYFFHFDGPMAKVLAPRVSLTIDYRVGGGELKRLVVLLKRAR